MGGPGPELCCSVPSRAAPGSARCPRAGHGPPAPHPRAGKAPAALTRRSRPAPRGGNGAEYLSRSPLKARPAPQPRGAQGCINYVSADGAARPRRAGLQTVGGEHRSPLQPLTPRAPSPSPAVFLPGVALLLCQGTSSVRCQMCRATEGCNTGAQTAQCITRVWGGGTPRAESSTSPGEPPHVLLGSPQRPPCGPFPGLSCPSSAPTAPASPPGSRC